VPGVIQKDFAAHCTNLPTLLEELVRREGIQSVVLGASWLAYQGSTIERNGVELPTSSPEGQIAFFANLDDYVRVLQSLGAKVYLVLGSPVDINSLNPRAMVTRHFTNLSVAADAGKAVPMAELRASVARADAKLRSVGAQTGAVLLDPFPDICGTADSCSPFFDGDEPKFSDGMHLRPKFVRDHITFLDFLLK
jgi:hypothetical protein